MSTIKLDELTISETQDAYRRGTYTAQDLVAAYISRINAVDRDKQGPMLNSITVVNDEAMAEAKKLDEYYATTANLKGPLHGIPVVVKDNVLTKGIVTSFGSIVAKDFKPKEDAALVTKLKDAGAIILAKSCLPDFGTDYFSTSSISGHTRNPYDLSRDTGASSSGTAAAVAANLALVGVGGDSAGSIRIPSSFCNLVGLRPTVGLVSAIGCSVGIKGQSTNGPMGRTVKDVALLLDTLAGFDKSDPFTSVHLTAPPPAGGSYAANLSQDVSSTVKIGVVRSAFGDTNDSQQAAVNNVITAALGTLGAAGFTVVDVEVPGLEHYLTSTNMFLTRSRADMDAFMKPLLGTSIAELASSGQHPKENVMIPYVAARGAASPYDEPETYAKQADLQQEFQRVVASSMLQHGVSALAFPTTKLPAPRYVDIDSKMRASFPMNVGFASQLRWPAVSVPAGFTPAALNGVELPVGLELVGPPLSDQTLLNLAANVERLVGARRTPSLKAASRASANI